ncbi:MAG: AAA domain-containing protein [Bacteroidota bacterium]
MNPAKLAKAASQQQTPLVNLFAYIRDLFQTNEPVTRFDAASDHAHWPISPWYEWQTQDHPAFQFQYEDIHQAILRIQRSQIPEINPPEELQHWLLEFEEADGPVLQHKHTLLEKFEADPERESLFRDFQEIVEGKAIEEISHTSIPEPLQGWLTVTEQEGRIYISKKDLSVPFHADDHRVQLYESYERVFRHHHEYYGIVGKVNQLYDSLHTLFYQLKAQPQQQLYLSFGLVSGIIGKEAYHNFLFHVPITIKLVNQELSLWVENLTEPVRCEQHFSQLFPEEFSYQPDSAITQKQWEVLHKVDAWNRSPKPFSLEAGYLHQGYYQYAKDILAVFPEIHDVFFQNHELNLQAIKEIPQEGISLSFSPTLQVKARDTQIQIANDAQNIISNIQEMVNGERAGDIPDFFTKLFSLEKPDPSIRIAYRKKVLRSLDDEMVSMAQEHPFLFPLPFNEEQLEIAKRLEKQDAVTVKGPPGTGKSHTIANITSHYVAQGKSILIVSKNAKALEVIRGKLPTSIRNLAISLVEDNLQHEHMKYAIDAIKDNLSLTYQESELSRLHDQLNQIEVEEEKLIDLIQAGIAIPDQVFSLVHPLNGEEHTHTSAEWVRYWKQHAPVLKLWLEGEEGLEQQAEILESVYTYLQSMVGQRYEDAALLAYSFPDAGNWMEVPSFQQLIQDLLESKETIGNENLTSVPLHIDKAEWIAQTDAVKKEVAYLIEAAPLLHHSATKIHELADLEDQYPEVLRTGKAKLMAHIFELGELTEVEPEVLLQQIRALKEKFGEKESIPALKRKMLPSWTKAYWNCEIDAIPLSTRSQLLLLEEWVIYKQAQKSWFTLVSNVYAQAEIQLENDQLERAGEALLNVIQALDGITPFNQYLTSYGLPILNPEHTYLSRQWEWLLKVPAWLTFNYAKQTLADFIQQLNAQKSENIHDSFLEVREACMSLDAEAYEASLKRFQESKAKKVLIHQAEEAFRESESLASETTHMLKSRMEEVDVVTEELKESLWQDLNEEVFGLQISQLISKVLSRVEENQTHFKSLQQLKKKREWLISELVAYQTWYHRSRIVSDEEKSALSAWRNDLINIGKGYGKNTARNMESAIANMQRARHVVPIWIMQQDTAITFFPEPEPGQFDLLIIDEASQCDISMLNLIYRAKKCMIVGDENQTSVSVQPNLFPIERTNQLLDRHMMHHPFRQQFNINNRTTSIYTLSGVIYPNIVTLREHFRCRPEIIEFCNRYVYNNQIIPLKTATDDRYGPAVEVQYVEDQGEDPKKARIVDKVLKLILDLITDYESGHLPELPTIGVLTLDASHEAHRELLIKKLTAHSQIRKYEDELNILVGTSRKFQGDERDVMILTISANHKIDKQGRIRPPRAVLGEEMLRIYNVAASRAREKSILLHSIHPDAVALMNPECLRSKLIHYYEDHQAEDLGRVDINALKTKAEMCSPLSKEVCDGLIHMGWANHLQTNLKIGPYRIDLAIIKDGRKLAIMCDDKAMDSAKEAIRQQLVLERAGWQFFRVQPLSWIHDKAGVMEDIRAFLHSFVEEEKEE